MKKESPFWSSISLLIGIVIAILALVRGRMLLPLLLAVFALWLLWWLLTQALPLWRNNRAYRAKEARLREQTAAANGGGQLADADIRKDSRIWVQGFLELVDCTRNGGSERDKRLKLSLTGWQLKSPRTERRPARKQSPGAARPPLPPVEVVDGDRERLPE